MVRDKEPDLRHPKTGGPLNRLVTVDTGGPDDIFVGALVTWIHVPRGGYGYECPVDAKVLLVGREMVRIEIKTKAGEIVERAVRASSLRWRK